MSWRLLRGPETGEVRSGRVCYLEGLLITLSNPKVILFYCSLLPAFINLEAVSIPYALVIVFVDAFILGLIMTGYSFVAMQTGRKFRSRKGIKLLNRGSGLLMAAAGTVMIIKK